MAEVAGRVFSVAAEHRPATGCTTSAASLAGEGASVSHFALAADTDISAELYDYPRLLILHEGEAEVFGNEAPAASLAAGDALVAPVGTPVGVRTRTGAVYTEVDMRKDTTMNDAIKAGQAFELGDLVPYQEGTIVNRDVAKNDAMKFAVMSFDAGCALSEHAAPGDALVLALDGEGVIGYEGQEHVIRAGESFRFDKGGRHYVRAERPFKMALLVLFR